MVGRTRGKHGGQPVGGRPRSLREPNHKEEKGAGRWQREVGCGLWDLRRRGSLQGEVPRDSLFPSHLFERLTSSLS